MVFVEILVSVLAAFGVFCLFKLIAEEWLIPDSQLPPQCIRLNGDESDEEIMARAMLIMQATLERRDKEIARLQPRAEGQRPSPSAFNLRPLTFDE